MRAGEIRTEAVKQQERDKDDYVGGDGGDDNYQFNAHTCRVKASESYFHPREVAGECCEIIYYRVGR